jgi:predicted hydrocarbon binding protein
MHGTIMRSFGEYTRASCSSKANAALSAILPSGPAALLRATPDVQAMAAIAVVANVERRPVAAVLESYGRFFVRWAAPEYPTAFYPADARAFLRDIDRVHAIVRRVSPGAEPPDIRVEEPAPDRLVLIYASPRGLCALARGMIRGVAEHYGEVVTIEQTTCMSEGAPVCRFDVRFR